MDKKKVSNTGMRVTIPQGTDEAAAVDAVVTDFLKGDLNATLRDLHEPHSEESGHTTSTSDKLQK